jgi:hypothetical protein
MEEMHRAERRGVSATPEQQRDKLIQWMESLTWFSGRMSGKMLKNLHKSGWRGLPIEYLRWRLGEEVKELDEALASHKFNSQDDIVNECADIANFAMMIADVVRDRGGCSRADCERLAYE